MEVSVTASVEHIDRFAPPQALIIDHQGREDAFFTRSIRSKALSMGKSLIELPSNAAENLMWIARLDSASLAGMTLHELELYIVLRRI